MRPVADRLSVELESAWQDLSECSRAIARTASDVRQPPRRQERLEDLRTWYEETTRILLTDPIGDLLRLRPVQRAIEATRAWPPPQKRSAWMRRLLDWRFLRMMTLAEVDASEPWRIWRAGNSANEWSGWLRRQDARARTAGRLLARYTRLEQSVRSPDLPPSNDANEAERDGLAAARSLDVELALRNLTVAWFDATRVWRDETRGERQNLRSHAGATLDWLQRGAPSSDAPDGFDLIAADDRLRAWAAPIEAQASRAMADRAELLAPRTAATVGRGRRVVAVHDTFLHTFDAYGRRPMRAIVERCWDTSAAQLREIEQVREMMAYWREASSEDSAHAGPPIEEARHNAIVRLTELLNAPADPEPLDVLTADAFRQWLERGSIAFEGEEYGWFALLQRPRGRAFLDTAFDASREKLVGAVRRAGRWTSGRVDRTLESVAGRVPSHPVLPPVVRRTTLRDTLALPAGRRDLPALYRLLFRLAPVDDRRFLFGREQELAGLRQALDDWRSGRFAACLIVGARGSGKTSLLNCATRDIFAGESLVRAEFDQRITCADRLDQFFRALLQLRDGDDIETAFGSARRVVILEEGERIFLRTVGGFAAAHHLADLVHRTGSSTLWIVVMNDRSFRVLDAATDLHRVFSHRINAMNVSRDDLERAILERHRLTGLRLEFAPPPPGDPRVRRVRRWFGLEESAQSLFFDSLFQQSDGVFRSAFQLWLASIERVDGETLRIRQPLDPAFGIFRRELAQEDQFTLLVVQEHGSLTATELADVLYEPADASRSRMERLMALGLLEPDPAHHGMRMNPEAQRFVNDLLRRANLM